MVKLENHEKVEALKSAINKLQEDLAQQQIVTQTVTEDGKNQEKSRTLEDSV